jgi:hypothetical protein
MSRPAQPLLAAITERELQATVVEAALMSGLWLPPYHPYDSRRSASGWPDLTLVGHPRRRLRGLIVFLEFKNERRKPTVEQELYLEGLRACASVTCELVRPRDLDRILELVRGGRRIGTRWQPDLELAAPTTARAEAEAAHVGAGHRTLATAQDGP